MLVYSNSLGASLFVGGSLGISFTGKADIEKYFWGLVSFGEPNEKLINAGVNVVAIGFIVVGVMHAVEKCGEYFGRS